MRVASTSRRWPARFLGSEIVSSVSEDLRQSVMSQAQGALLLNLAYIGVVDGLFSALAKLGQATPDALAAAAQKDGAYVLRWCDGAYAFGLLDESAPGEFSLTELGSAFRPEAAGTLMPFAVQAVLSAHMAERAAGLMATGDRPGEQVLAERETVLPWFGPMLEHNFGPLLERDILAAVPVYRQVDERGGLVIDLGCGNGWYLRRLASRFPHVRGLGLDGFAENIEQAERIAAQDGLAERLRFDTGNIYDFHVDEAADLIAMNRALHHVWSDKEKVFRILHGQLKSGGTAVIWEPHWPSDRAALREPGRRGMAFQNLSEHVQGNHFLHPDEIVAEFEQVGMQAQVYLFADGREAVVSAVRTD